MMRKFGLIAVFAGVVAFAGPALAQGCGGFFHTASEKQMTTSQSAPLQSKPAGQDKKG
tara:strand:+ start:227 stop:400 length:174 start_codon:yes stop_codon:yes gene_type:complete